ncbi:MAG: hypothetical protein ACK5CY_08220 [Bacteroidia bacterium]|jgi:hypothetical protein
MDVRRMQEEINHLLIKLEEQYGRILSYNEKIPVVEIDLVLKDVRDLYEGFLDLRTAAEWQRRNEKPAEQAAPQAQPVSKPEAAITNVQAAPASVKSETTAIVETAKVEEPAKESAKEDESTVASAPKVQDPVIATNVALPSENPPVVGPKVDLLQERQKDFVPTVRKIGLKTPEPEPVVSEPKKESLFDKATSLYDKITKPAEKTVAGQVSRQPISNIKAAIGINEKFLYLKELFKNNVNDYNEALEKLNNFDSYMEAEDFFQELKTKYSWNPESKSFQGLAELLNRRYLHQE